LITNAGYGIMFLGSPGSTIKNLKVTGGRRDPDGMATDAAIVARNSRVTITGCLIADNTNRPDTLVVGIGGIFGREGAELFIIGNRLFSNGWDGIALYRGATAVIADNVINGGRGAGIGITWDAIAEVYRNTIENYWKGIGAFGASRAIISNNIVRNNLGWGIIATGEAYVDVTNNIVTQNGNCGMAIWSDDCVGRFANNIVIENGWREEWVCPPVGFWNYGYLKNFTITHNDIFNNKEGEYRDMPDYTDKFGNLSIDPLFVGEDDYHLTPQSPCINAGDSTITDNDGSISDIGLYSGPRAKR
jgi:parallel beta-helix repeat protein